MRSPLVASLALSLLAVAVLRAQAPTSSVQAEGSASQYERNGYRLTTAGNVGVSGGGDDAVLSLNFSIGRPDGDTFDNLTAAALRATAEQSAATAPVSIPIGPSDLSSEPQTGPGVVFVLDVSGSMLPLRGALVPIDKLSAAKQALRTFIDRLRPNEPIGIVTFSDEPSLAFPMSANKAEAKETVAAITHSTAQYTALYDAVRVAVRYAGENKVRNVVFLTDGVDDTPETRRYNNDPSDPRLAQIKREEEASIKSEAAEAGRVRVYTIGIGDRDGRLDDFTYVDMDSLGNISTETGVANGSHYVSIPELTSSLSGPGGFEGVLRTRLDAVLRIINASFQYDYTLRLRPPSGALVRDGQPHKIHIECTVGDAVLPVEFTYRWASPTGAGANGNDEGPQVEAPVVLSVFFKTPVVPVAPPPSSTTSLGGHVTVYPDPPAPDFGVGFLTGVLASYLAGLGLLAFIPVVLRQVEARQIRKINAEAVVVVPKRSPIIGKECPHEERKLGTSFLFKAGDATVVCPGCSTAHHVGCWHMNKDRCWVRTCGRHVALSADVLKAYGEED